MRANTLLAIGVFLVYFLIGVFALFLRWLDRQPGQMGRTGWRQWLLWGRGVNPIETRITWWKNRKRYLCVSLRKLQRIIYSYCIFMGLIKMLEVAMGRESFMPEDFYYFVGALIGGSSIILFRLLIYWTNIMLRHLRDDRSSI